MTEILKTQASNFAKDPRFNWKLVEFSKHHDFVCTEVYSVCCQGDQQVENYNNLIVSA